MTETMTEAEALIGARHLLSGSRYKGCYEVTAILAVEGEWIQFESISDGGFRMIWSTRLADAFATEAEARAEAKARRRPRRTEPATMYGDLPLVGMFLGVDPRTGRKLNSTRGAGR